MLVGMILIQFPSTSSKEDEIELVTERKIWAMFSSLQSHGATIVQGQGVFTGQPRYIVTMVVSSYEVRDVVKNRPKEIPTFFIQVVSLAQVYGRFS